MPTPLPAPRVIHCRGRPERNLRRRDAFEPILDRFEDSRGVGGGATELAMPEGDAAGVVGKRRGETEGMEEGGVDKGKGREE
jgi:hypothetical protein